LNENVLNDDVEAFIIKSDFYTSVSLPSFPCMIVTHCFYLKYLIVLFYR